MLSAASLSRSSSLWWKDHLQSTVGCPAWFVFILRKCSGWFWDCCVVEVQSLDGLPPLRVLAAQPPTLMSGTTAASSRSVDLCLAARGIADEGAGASADRKSAAVAGSCCLRELSNRWPLNPSPGKLPLGHTGFAGFNGGGRCNTTTCGTRWNSWQWSSAILSCRGGLGYHKQSIVVRGWFECPWREEAEGRRQPAMGHPLK